jgi:hypothetical protein
MPIGEPTLRDLLTVRYGAESGPSATALATVTNRRPLGVKLCSELVYVPSLDIFPKVNQITY